MKQLKLENSNKKAMSQITIGLILLVILILIVLAIFFSQAQNFKNILGIN